MLGYFIGEIDEVQTFVGAGILEALEPQCSCLVGMSPRKGCQVVDKQVGEWSSVPMEHDPLRNGHYAFLRLIERGQFGAHTVIRIRHYSLSTWLLRCECENRQDCLRKLSSYC